MSQQQRNLLIAVLKTLDQVSVSGEENLDMLLASIRTIRRVLDTIEEDNDGRTDTEDN